MHHIGLDFGTNYTSASRINPDTGKPEPVRFMDNGQEKMPSLVFYSEYGTLVGQGVQSQIEQFSNFPPHERMKAQQSIVRSLKRMLNPSGTHIVPGKGPVRHVDIVRDIFSYVKQDVEAGCFSGEKVEKVTLTHPVVCTEAYRKLIKKAAETAGFKEVELLEEPVAAAMGYAASGARVGQGILVYDFGGGTFDVAFVLRDDKGNFRIPIPSLGDPWCGGDDLDMRLYEYWDRKAQEKNGRCIGGNAGDVDAGFLFRCRRHKETLSRMPRMDLIEYLPPMDGVLNPTDNRLALTLDQEIIKQLFVTDVGRTIEITKRMLKNVESSGYKIDTVLLVGGSSRLPLVKELLKEILPVPPLETMNVDVAVAMGAVQKNNNTLKEDLKKEPSFITTVSEKPSVKRKAGDIHSFTVDGVNFDMVYIPPGEFMMGSPEQEEERYNDETQHRVRLTKGFYLQRTQVSQIQWEKVMGFNPSYFHDCLNCPVEWVTWYDAVAFCNALSEREGRRSAYEMSVKRRDDKHIKDAEVTLVLDTDGFRLPTEAEWEYACRAGTTTSFSFGENITSTQVNYDGNYSYAGGQKSKYREKTIAAGSLPPNSWGLYEMHGNVCEWCNDWYEKYPFETAIDPTGPSTGSSRVIRGGSWYDNPRNVRAAIRNEYVPGLAFSYVGFRVCAPRVR